ncbi:hypothetical protein [Natronorubrum sulfidifaciens]|uniref:Uncharacterized protein n=1 Tax=Natronorubrum sulfidifaciens JCM 14089 TaxID=1230460 RepID=L9W8D7_9EURY|nr:hypothetical protein [Natronorubrum sulfidifaciens]ELY45597.1 hypothetical protein C495_08090 [Natronorubrum sulfidifaciens JCM 14089]
MSEPALEEHDLEPRLETIDDLEATDTTLLETLLTELRALRAENERLTTRIDTLEDTVDALEQTVDDPETKTNTLESRSTDLETTTETLESTTTDLETRLETNETDLERVDALTQATRNRTGATKARLEELQARELEKGAHLRAEHVDEHAVDVPDGRLEKITKDDGHAYYRLPERDDPLDRTNTTLAHGDLLPIQQLARLDEDMRRATTNALPTRLAAKLWKARTDSSVGDDPWKTGCKSINEYVTASDLKHWIRRQEPGTSETYAKKLVSRVIDAALEFSKNRLAVRKRTQRKNGLEYTERRLILPEDAEIPGEMSSHTADSPETAGVRG